MTDSLITIKNLSLSLGGTSIIQNMNVSFDEGEFIAILGPNGAGKSTLLKILLGLLTPSTGIVSVLGKKPHRGNADIGYAPQHRVLETDVALRACDIVGFGIDGNKWGISLPNKNREFQIDQALQSVDLLESKNSPVGALSGGEQQRLFIAQALIAQPKILLLDEPLSNLDINHGQEIISLLSKLAKERKITILLVSHDINPLLSSIDRVLYMTQGKSAIGKPDEVITSERLSALYNTQVDVIKTKGRIFVVGAEI